MQVLPEDYSLANTALFFARAAIANYDAQLTGWKVKYHTLHWRPITAFRLGYPGFQPVPEWTSLLRIPAHPEYPSGHTVTVGAILEVLLRTPGIKDQVGVQCRSHAAVACWFAPFNVALLQLMVCHSMRSMPGPAT